MSYRPTNFVIQELVPPIIFNAMGERAWELLDERALRTLQALRDKFGPITINTWHSGGGFKESGLREQNTTTGAPRSAHKRGMAFDCKPKFCTPREMYDYILDNQGEFPLIRRLEHIDSTPTWLHFDVVNHPGPRIRVFRP